MVDASIIRGSQTFNDLVARWLDSRQPADAAEILAWFQAIEQSAVYSDIRLVDTSGRVLLDSRGNGSPLALDALEALSSALVGNVAALAEALAIAVREVLDRRGT